MRCLALHSRQGLDQRNLAVFLAAPTRSLLDALPAPQCQPVYSPREGPGSEGLRLEEGLTCSTVPHICKVATGNGKNDQAHGCVQKPKFTEQVVSRPGCQRLFLLNLVAEMNVI